MKLLSLLFFRRRWVLWIPVPATTLLAAAGSQPLNYIHTLIGGLVFWIPFWLAWWLSDGFSTVCLGEPGVQSDTSHEKDELFWNYAEGHYQNFPGSNTSRT